MTAELFKIVAAISLSIWFFAWILYPLKRFLGRLGFPPNHNFVMSLREGHLRDEVKRVIGQWSEERAAQLVSLFFNYVMVAYVFAFTVTGLVFLYYRDVVENISLVDMGQILMSGFVLGLFVASCSRIAAVHHSTTLLRSLFSVVSISLALVVCIIVIDLDLMTELTDYGLKPYYADFAAHSVWIVLAVFFVTEIVIDITRGIFPVSRVVPVALFDDLGQLYYERPSAFGKEEVTRLALDLLAKCEKDFGRLRTMHLVTLNNEEVFFERVKRLIAMQKDRVPVIKIITVASVAPMLKDKLGDVAHIVACEREESLRWERFMILNEAVGIVFRRIPSSGEEGANVAQLIDGFVEVQLALYAFNSQYDMLARRAQDVQQAVR